MVSSKTQLLFGVCSSCNSKQSFKLSVRPWMQKLKNNNIEKKRCQQKYRLDECCHICLQAVTGFDQFIGNVIGCSAGCSGTFHGTCVKCLFNCNHRELSTTLNHPYLTPPVKCPTCRGTWRGTSNYKAVTLKEIVAQHDGDTIVLTLDNDGSDNQIVSEFAVLKEDADATAATGCDPTRIKVRIRTKPYNGSQGSLFYVSNTMHTGTFTKWLRSLT
eukprot:GHVH01000098.1.p1 GENE.GHVH01000098.1~~GHVH01000098.1.p1  ORF type:complete len:216 (+),score=19.71 GHVH01000098.1:96-743(+)